MHMSNGKSMSVSASTCTTCVAAKEHKRGDNVAVHNLRWPRPPATTAFDRNRCFRVLNPLQLHKKLSLRVIGTVHRVVGTGTCPGTTKQTKCALPEIRLGRPISGSEAQGCVPVYWTVGAKLHAPRSPRSKTNPSVISGNLALPCRGGCGGRQAKSIFKIRELGFPLLRGEEGIQRSSYRRSPGPIHVEHKKSCRNGWQKRNRPKSATRTSLGRPPPARPPDIYTADREQSQIKRI